MKKVIVGIIVIAGIVASGGAYYAYRRQPKPPEITKAAISRGIRRPRDSCTAPREM